MVCTERRGVNGIRDAWQGQHWLKLTANKQREKTLYQLVPLSLFIQLHPVAACTFDLFYSLHFTIRPSCRPLYFDVAATSHKLCACALGMLDEAGCRLRILYVLQFTNSGLQSLYILHHITQLHGRGWIPVSLCSAEERTRTRWRQRFAQVMFDQLSLFSDKREAFFTS